MAPQKSDDPVNEKAMAKRCGLQQGLALGAELHALGASAVSSSGEHLDSDGTDRHGHTVTSQDHSDGGDSAQPGRDAAPAVTDHPHVVMGSILDHVPLSPELEDYIERAKVDSRATGDWSPFQSEEECDHFMRIPMNHPDWLALSAREEAKARAAATPQTAAAPAPPTRQAANGGRVDL